MKLKIEYLSKDQLKPYASNAKIHTAEQVEQIKNSIRQFGFNDPIAIWHDNEIVEGHGRLLAVMEMPEIESVPVIRLDEMTDEQRRAYMLVHNKLTMNTDFDLDLLNLELSDIVDIDMDQFGFDLSINDEDDLNPYTSEIKIPQYQVHGEAPRIEELYDTEKADWLIDEIQNSECSEKEKRFLTEAAKRHNRFNYQKIAEYYAGASEQMQRLMERSALVIIDYNDAIANGYVILSNRLKEMREEYEG